jgi:methionine aminopeptidase
MFGSRPTVASGMPLWGYRTQAPRLLADGDVIYAEGLSPFGGLHTQHQATITVGDVHQDFCRASDVARQSYHAGLAAVRPGRTFGDVVEAMHAPPTQTTGTSRDCCTDR